MRPWAGVLVEHVDKRRLLLATQSLQVVFATTLGLLVEASVELVTGNAAAAR